jgi:A/G-specific adenine glycosylase
VIDEVLTWYERHARPLPWREPGATPWGVMVSEFMLQQTPLARVLPLYATWMQRWPTPAALAAEPQAEAVRMWGRLGYPRRAMRLHACAVEIVAAYGGQVPSDWAVLRSLPGVGDYTASAIASFAFGQRHPVLDVNVRRVHARFFDALAFEPAGAPTRSERDRAEAILPDDPARASRFSAAVMELGALVCTARSPSCGACPIASECAWLGAGRPEQDGPARTGQPYAGTDRQVRGLLLDVLRAHDRVEVRILNETWADDVQRDRALQSLLDDGLVAQDSAGSYSLA